ncbi:hypothetical protein F5Y04DRAFT_257126 [Hypomontagnella monticulosa]|nr:hypothetical protein F5Y04DRAFT_257126 [Hypomontagnella monticulosa]
MESTKENDGDTAMVSSSPTQLAQPSAPRAPSPAPSTASSTGRPPYMPQFSMATQMILKRINSKTPGSVSSAISSASSALPKTSIEKSAFEDTKRRLMLKMNTSMAMPMPLPKNPPPAPSATQKAPANTLRMPMNDAFQLRTPLPSKSSPATKQSAQTQAQTQEQAQTQKMPVQKAKGKSQRGTKRKRGKENDGDEDTSSDLSDLSDSEIDAATGAAKESQVAPTMTKSGRQVQKPSQYNPSQQQARDAAASQKRKGYGKRTPEQALCKLCTRSVGVPTNQIVFCDGCNNCWHQLCHDPYIDDDFVSNEARPWFCGRCSAKREKHLARKKNLENFKGASWSHKAPEQKRSYLTGVPHAQLVNIIMYSTELHPDLPIFPVDNKRGGAQSRSHYDHRLKANDIGPTHYSSKFSTPDSHSLSAKAGAKAAATDSRDQTVRESSVDSVPPSWPKVGEGCLKGIVFPEEEFQDGNDYEAFSVTTYDSKGKKIMENGKPV